MIETFMVLCYVMTASVTIMYIADILVRFKGMYISWYKFIDIRRLPGGSFEVLTGLVFFSLAVTFIVDDNAKYVINSIVQSIIFLVRIGYIKVDQTT